MFYYPAQSLEAVFLKLAYQLSQGEDEKTSVELAKVDVCRDLKDLVICILDQHSYIADPAIKD